MLLFRGQRLDRVRHVAYSGRFGELELHLAGDHRDPVHPEIFLIGNVREAGGGVPNLNRNGIEWHSDSSFIAEPSLGSLMYCRVTPTVGGGTWFADARAAWDGLPEPLKEQAKGLSAVHSYTWFHDRICRVNPGRRRLTDAERAGHPDVRHPLVRRHPVTGRPSLYVCPDVMKEIPGLDADAAAALVEALMAHATAEDVVYRHRWQVGDLVVWDNRCTMHTAVPYDFDREPRLMHRTTVAGSAPLPAFPEAVAGP